MIRFQYHYLRRTVLGFGLLLLLVGCSNQQPDDAPLVDAISKTIGLPMPANATILACRHRHDDKGSLQCSQLWVVQASAPLTVPGHQASQTNATSPFTSLQLLVKQATDGRVLIEAADRTTTCQCAEWRHGETMCRLRQSQTRTGWVAALEAVSPE